MLIFVVGLMDAGMASSSAASYVAGVQHSIVVKLGVDEKKTLYAALSGFQRISRRQIRRKLPITTEILKKIHVMCNPEIRDMGVWAVITVGVFGLFRLGELVPSKPTDFSGWYHPTMGSITATSSLAKNPKPLRRPRPPAVQPTWAGLTLGAAGQGLELECGFGNDSSQDYQDRSGGQKK
ncbi:MAG: hypothetical protein GY696_02745, partial [Gammaproteobacteria bacterium]|nr:hypothetical protein [Gammaproteobacteria bacterium]